MPVIALPLSTTYHTQRHASTIPIQRLIVHLGYSDCAGGGWGKYAQAKDRGTSPWRSGSSQVDGGACGSILRGDHSCRVPPSNWVSNGSVWPQ